MGVGLLLAAYAFIVFGLCARGRGWRAAAIDAATVWGVLVVLITELLSLADGLTRKNLASAWLVVDVASLIYFGKAGFPLVRQHGLRVFPPRDRSTTYKLPKGAIVLLSGVAAIVAIVAVVALLSPPQTADAMAYHMPRIVYWIQNQSVAFFPTPELRQLCMPPWTEFAILHGHVLFGSDHLDNLVQWCSFLGSVVGVTLLAQSMGAGWRGQVLAAVLCVAIPQGILEASGAKNDYVVAFWLLVLAYYLFSFKLEPTLANTFGIGGALGLAWLTKATAYVFSPALLLMGVFACAGKAKMTFLKRLPLVLVIALGLNAGHLVRSYSLSGYHLGTDDSISDDMSDQMVIGGCTFHRPAHRSSITPSYTNDTMTVKGLTSNILRNLALHLGSPFPAVNSWVEHFFENLIYAIGDDPNNPHTTWSKARFRVHEMSNHEGLAGNPVHVLLIMLTLGLMIGRRGLRSANDVGVYTLGLVLAFMLFCAVFKWQPWHTRLHLPLFVLWTAAVGVILVQALPPAVTTGLGILLLLLSFPAVVGNETRPLVRGGELYLLRQDRNALYFSGYRAILDWYWLITGFVKRHHCEDIGIDAPLGIPMYQLLALLDVDKGIRRVQHINVTNPSARYGEKRGGFAPCAVICLACSMTTEKWNEYLSRVGPATVFGNIARFGNTAVFAKIAPQSNPNANARISPQCTLTYGPEWGDGNEDLWGRWRWSSSRGTIRGFAEQEKDMVMYGDILSIQPQNKMDILVNDEKVLTRQTPWGPLVAFEPFRLHLRRGENSLVFVSHAPANHTPTDSPAVALMVRNLLITSADGGTICALEP